VADSDGGQPAIVIERRSGGGGIGLFLLGLAVGAGIALLYAPQAGDETRAALRSGARRMRRQVRDAAEDARSEIERRLARHPRPAKSHDVDGEDDGV
jgi:gas vesicle protein